MKKRIFSVLLVAIFVLSFMPITALATGEYEAKIGSEEYLTLEAAIADVQNDETIVMLQNVTYENPITISNGKTFTIDFVDKTFTWNDEYEDEDSPVDIFTIADSNVTVKNMQYKKASDKVKGNRVFTVNSTGKLTLSNMTCNSGDNIKDTPVRNNGGTVTIDGGNIAITNASDLLLLNPVVQNLGGTTTFTGNGTYTMQQNTGAAWLGKVITTPDPSANPDNDCGTVIIENGTFNTGHIVDVNGKGNITINNAIFISNTIAINIFHGGIKSTITINNITSSTSIFAYLYDELNTKINFQNGNVKYTPGRFCINSSGSPMASVSIKNGKFGPKTGSNDIHDEIEGSLAQGATLTALTGDPDGYTYKVESPHNHSFTYTANDNKLTATCTAGCDKGYNTNPLTLTLTESYYEYEGRAMEVDFIYGESEKWTNAGLELPTITYTAKTGSKLTDGKAVDAGSYTASVTVNEKTASIDFTINKANMMVGTNITAPSVPYSPLVFNRQPQQLLNSGLTYDEKDGSEFGTFYYSANGTNWSTELPTAIAAGEYNPLWYFVGDNNHNNIGSKENPISQLYPVVIDPAHQTHNLVKVAGQAPTETKSGWKDYYECKDSDDACGALFEDADGTTPIENLDNWKAVGGNGYIAPLVHKPELVNGKNATYTEAGYKSYYKCENCGKYYEDAEGLIEISNIDTWKAESGRGYLPKLEKDPDSPKTGDTNSMTLWLILLTISYMGLFAYIIFEKMKNE